MAVVPGVGYLVANDILTDVAFWLFEPIVSLTLPAAIGVSWQTIDLWSAAIYDGALLVVGNIGSADIEVVTVGGSVPGTSFQIKCQNAHAAGEPITGPTFPVQQASGDFFFTQTEMLGYLANAVNDFLVRCPLVYVYSKLVSLKPTEYVTDLPNDVMTPVRVSTAGKSLRETSQSNLDAVDYAWQNRAPAPPYAYYRDKLGPYKLGVFPRANNTVPLEIVYEARGPQNIGLADGFLLPDPFLVYVKYRVLSFAYSKDGEQKSPAMAKYFNDRFETGVKICNIFIKAIMDPNLQ